MATLLQPAVLPDSLRRSRPFGRVYQSQGFERSAEDVVVADFEPFVEDGGVVRAMASSTVEEFDTSGALAPMLNRRTTCEMRSRPDTEEALPAARDRTAAT
jgi:hypothetical protein